MEERGLLVNQKGQMQNPYYFDYSPNTRNKTEVQLSRKLVVKASDIRKMDEESVLQLVGRLLDVAQDAGAHVGPQNNMNSYYYYRWGMEPPNGPGPLHPRGFRQAPGGSLREGDRRRSGPGGTAGAVEPRGARPDRRHPGGLRPRRARPTIMPTRRCPRKRLEMSRFQEIPVRVELMVRFEVHHPKAERKGQAGQP